MKKRTLTLVALLLTALVASAQDLRESVCVVHSECTEEVKTKLADYALWLSRKGFYSEARALTAYKGGTKGSGVVILQDGNRYVVTNRHVVGYASEVTLDFVLRRETRTFEHCLVLTVDTLADLALIALPDSCSQPALPLLKGEMEEGVDIVAAGFPGLDGKPSWQLTKGAVSNAYLQIEEVNHPLVQHTAAIDPGSSGGPLLVKKEDGYQIAGINTLKAYRRENVGLAIPASTLEEFVSKAGTLQVLDQQMLMDLTESGEAWSLTFDKMPKECIDSLRKMDVEMPLDVVTNTYTLECAPLLTEKERARLEKGMSTEVIDHDVDIYGLVRLEYTNYFSSRNQQLSLAIEYNWHYFFVGGQVSFLMDEYQDSFVGKATRSQFGTGIRLGGQIPMNMAKDWGALVRLMIAPETTPLGFMGVTDGPESFMNIPFSAGVDFCYSHKDQKKVSFGLHYVYDLQMLISAHGIIQTPNRKLFSGNIVDFIGQNGLQLSVAYWW